MQIRFRYLALLLIAVFAAGSVSALAQSNPIQLSLFNPVQIVPENEAVGGVRLNLIYTKNSAMTGFDLGLVNTTTGSVTGVQWALVGINGGDFTGWQNTAVSIVEGRFEGFQGPWALYNSAGHCSGLQLGLVNTAETMNGLQIGILNFIKRGGAFPFFPIVNWSFD